MTPEQEIKMLSDLLAEYRALAGWACVNRDDIDRLAELDKKFEAFQAEKTAGAI